MFSSLTERGAKATLEALVAGANDYVPKPTATDNDSIVARIESELVPKLKQSIGHLKKARTGATRQPPQS